MGWRYGKTQSLYACFASVIQRKIDLLMSHFGSQRSKQWFDAETFLGLARLRGWNAELRSAMRKRLSRANSHWV